MSKTYKRNDDNWERKRKQQEKKREKYEKKREFYNEPKTRREDDAPCEDHRRR